MPPLAFRSPNLRHSGFVLLLCLSLVSLLVILVISFTTCLLLETKNSAHALDQQRSRLNAWMGARLALAHLQQTAGPDQRSTATADLAGGFDATNAANRGVTHWTGVWRTDFPDEPPAWLISGGSDPAQVGRLAQSLLLTGTKDYPHDYWTPWHHDDLSASPLLVRQSYPTSDAQLESTHDDRIALPKISFDATDDGGPQGAFAYWIGDEGVKIRVNLANPSPVNHLAAANSYQSLRCPPRFGTELLTGLKSIDPNSEAFQVLTPASLALLPQSQTSLTASGLPIEPDFHHQTCWAAGLQVDSLRGGLRRDLSLAFEMDDSDFDASAFGHGNQDTAPVIESYTTDASQKSRRSWFPPYPAANLTSNPDTTDPRPRVWVPMHEINPDNPSRNLGTTGNAYAAWSPIFIREDEMGQPLRDTTPQAPLTSFADKPTNTPRRLVGPLWHLLRDYYRLYKELTWTATGPALAARSYFPNTAQFLAGGYRPSLSQDAYSTYNLEQAYWPNGGSYHSPYIDKTGDTPDPLGWPNGLKENHYLPRAVRGAYQPVLHQLSLALAVKQQRVGKNFSLQAICTPWVVLHNPYNVALTLSPATQPEPDRRVQDSGMRIALADWTNLSLKLISHANNSVTQSLSDLTGIRLTDLFSLQTSTSNPHGENLSLLLPATTLAPGEHLVFSAPQLLRATDLGDPKNEAARPILKLDRGFYPEGGFAADLATHALTALGNPDGRTKRWLRIFNADDCIQTWLSITETTWHQTVFIISGWKQNRANDAIRPDLLGPAEAEVLGSNRTNSTASQAGMVNLGTFNSLPGSFFGHAGDENSPVNLGPIQQLPVAPSATPGALIGLITTRLRLADTQRTTTYHRQTLLWSDAQKNPTPAANPLWLFSNPLAQSFTTPAQNGMPALGSPSWRTQIYAGDELNLPSDNQTWNSLLATPHPETHDAQTYGGYSHLTTGSLQNLVLEVPLAPPVSLGQFMHANLSPWDWFPYRCVGNSFPNLVCPLDKSWTHSTPAYVGGLTFADYSYLLNNALWDHFFLSGAAPTLNLQTLGDYPSQRITTTAETLNLWLQNQGSLANPHHRHYTPSLRANNTATDLNYRNIAGQILNDGAFNVNSTSVEAWLGFYGALKNHALAGWPKSSPSVFANARLPRVISLTPTPIAQPQITDSSYWAGWINLSDIQLQALAEATVAEIRARTSYFERTERDQEFPPTARRFLNFPTQAKPHTPFLSLGEFINRYLGPTKTIGAQVHPWPTLNRSFYPLENTAAPWPPLPASAEAQRWLFQSGTWESAIARADLTLGTQGLASVPTEGYTLNPSISHNWQYLSPHGERTGMPPGIYFRNLAIPNPSGQIRTHNGFGASGCLFQGDLLQALGPLIATRSDTFRIRTFGEGPSGKTPAWLEWIVQRTPEFMDTQNAAEAEISTLTPINRLLGRRFRILQARWLLAHEI